MNNTEGTPGNPVRKDYSPDAIGSIPVECPYCGDTWRAISQVGADMRCLNCDQVFAAPGGRPPQLVVGSVTFDQEIRAIDHVLRALEPLPEAARDRVLAFAADWAGFWGRR